MLPQLKGHSGTLGDLCSIRASPCPHLPVGTLYAQASLGAQDQRSPSLGTVFIQRSAVRSFCNLGASVYPSLQLSMVPPASRLMLGHLVFIRTSCQRPSSITPCLLPQSRPATFSTQQSNAGSVSVLEPAQHVRQAGAFAGTDFCRGDVLLGAGDDVWEPE